MRLQNLSLRNFRCFDEAEIDLSSDVIALYGRNGVGKTAMFDALEFGLLGCIGRFDRETDPPDYIPNVHTQGKAEVRIEFSNKSWIQAARDRSPNAKVKITTSLGTKSLRTFLYNSLVAPEYSPARQEISAVADLFRSTVLLSQHSIRNFIEGEPDERSKVISHLAGSAYFQRCLDKAIAVQKEARKRESIEQPVFDELTAQTKVLTDKLMETDSRIDMARKELTNQAVEFASVVKALRKAGYPLTILEPRNSEEADAFLIAVRSVQNELSLDLSTRSNLLSELFSLALSQPDRIRRQEQLRKNIGDANAKLIEAQKKESGLQEAAINHDKTLSILDSRINELLNHLKSIEDLRASAKSRDQLRERFELASATIESLDQEHKGLTESLKRLENGLLHAKLRRGSSQNILQNTVLADSELRSLWASLDQYKHAKTRIQDLTAQQQELHSKQNVLESQRVELNSLLAATELDASELDKRKSLFVGRTQEASHLVSQLRSYVEDSKCPLCGYDYSSQEALLDAIEQRLKFVSPEVQEMAKTEHAIVQKLEATKLDLAHVNGELESLDIEVRRVSEELQETRKIARNSDEKASRLGVLLESNALALSIKEREEAIAGIRSTIESIETEISDLQAKQNYAAERLELLATRLENEREQLSQMGQELDSIRLSIVGLRLNGVELDREEEFLKSIAAQIESEQAVKAIELNGQVETQSQLFSTRIEITSHRQGIDRWERELTEIIREIDHYEDRCRALDLGPDISSELIDQSRLTLSDRKHELEKAKILSEQYAMSLRLASLEAGRHVLQTELQTLETQVTIQEERRQKRLEVVMQSDKWITELSMNINDVVERRIESHTPEINRLFRSMIPTPYLFEGVVMSRGNGGLRLGIQYSGLKADSGEPKFFLSNAQANVLALSMFLSFALRNRWTMLRSVLLDDPIQHLDDLDAVAFLDNIRSVALGSLPRKQIILSTCDQDLYLLMIRKFRLLEPNGVRFTAISLSEKFIGAPQINYDVGGPADRLLQAG